MSQLVKEYTPEEARRYCAALAGSPVELHGHVDAVCREADGSVAWEVHKPNIITDSGRRRLVNNIWATSFIVTSPSTEAADPARTGLPDDGNTSSSQSSGTLNGTYDSITLTRTWANTFAAPAATRQIGTVGLTTRTWSSAFGVFQLMAYTVLTPVKTQGPTQTLEIVYRITLTPIY